MRERVRRRELRVVRGFPAGEPFELAVLGRASAAPRRSALALLAELRTLLAAR